MLALQQDVPLVPGFWRASVSQTAAQERPTESTVLAEAAVIGGEKHQARLEARGLCDCNALNAQGVARTIPDGHDCCFAPSGKRPESRTGQLRRRAAGPLEEGGFRQWGGNRAPRRPGHRLVEVDLQEV